MVRRRRSRLPAWKIRLPGIPKISPIGWLFLIVPVLLALAASYAIFSRLMSPAKPAPTSSAATPAPSLPETLVEFLVETPADTPGKEKVYLTIVDEVSGLAFNTERHPMKPRGKSENGRRQYTLTLPLKIGAVITYRYERGAEEAPVIEHNPDGRPVRNRLFYVQSQAKVTDIVSRWTDSQFNEPAGRIVGQVREQNTGIPLPDMLATAGGVQTLTRADGSFILDNLPAGTHTLVIYARDGAFKTFQQGALVASGATTPAPIQVTRAAQVKVLFIATLPKDTPPLVPVRMAGNLIQMGNTFANLAGGVSGQAERMPVMNPLPDGRYALTLTLPAGADLRYKYTLGDGYWNAELTADGKGNLRQLIVPSSNAVYEESVATWTTPGFEPVSFDLIVPPETPSTDTISLQFNPLFGWMEPLPMWKLGINRWGYLLFNPLNLPDGLRYRFCRNGQCGSADDVRTAGVNNPGFQVKTGRKPVKVQDFVPAWYWFDAVTQPGVGELTEVWPRSPSFVAGIELEAVPHPVWVELTRKNIGEIKAMSANWVILPATWTVTSQSPPNFEATPGNDLTSHETIELLREFQKQGLQTALFPSPRFPTSASEWWLETRRDEAWWQAWFDRCRAFYVHFAELATAGGAQALIIGGDWVAPALPEGLFEDGSPSGAPADAAQRWQNLIREVRSRFSGTLIWALPYDQLDQQPMFIDMADMVYLLWSEPLANPGDPSPAGLKAHAEALLDHEVWPNLLLYERPVILGLNYPSISGVLSGCPALPDSANPGGCLDLETNQSVQSLALQHFRLLPESESPSAARNTDEQALAYAALLAAVNDRDWISGFVSRGFYTPAALLDKSASIHGKPAAGIVNYWFSGFLNNPSP